MPSTGLLIVSNLARISNILRNISNHISQTLYISIADNSLPIVSYSDYLTAIYGQANKVCNSLDVRIIIGNLKSKIKITTHQPIDLVMYDNQNIISGEPRDFMMSSISTLKSNFSMQKIGDSSDGTSDNVIVEKNENTDDGVYDHIALGGTFDRLHNGHKILLSQGVLRAKKSLTVGVTDVNMIKSKKLWELIEPLDVRIDKLKQFLNDIDSSLQYNVVPIQDMYGPTKDDAKLQMLIVSQETFKGGEAVNKQRLINKIPPLAVYSIDLAGDSQVQSSEEESKVSSTNQRMRMLGTVLKQPKENPAIKPYPYVIGLTGGIASGKTKIAEKLKELGAGVVNCDLLAHELYKPGAPMNATIAASFGNDIITDSGEVDRKKLGNIVFNEPSRMVELNNLLWPVIIELARNRIDEMGKAGYKVVVMEAAVLIQAGWKDYCHEVWTTIIPPEEAIKRVMERNRMSDVAAKARVESQPSNLEQVAAANVVFCSFWSYDYTGTQVERAWDNLLKYLADKQMSHL